MIRVGIIGCGRIGQVHAISVEKNRACSLTAVYDPSADNAGAMAERFGASVAGSAEDIMQSGQVDLVVIASPTDAHEQQFLSSARAGKAVFGEKPIDNNLARAHATVKALREIDVPVMMGFNRRYDRDHAALRAEVRAGGIGRIQSMQLASRGPNSVPTRQYLQGSGGFYRDKCVHFLDLIRWISGEEAVDIVAMGSVMADASVAEAGDVDTAAIVVRLQSGALAHIDNARRAAYGYDDRIEVFGTKGVIESSRLRRGNVMRITGDTVQLDGLPKNSFERYSGSYAAALDAFIDKLGGQDVEVPTIEDGLMAQVMAEAATLSAAQGRIVRIDEVLAGL
ncbi:MAG: Gfo/Idh/MocA family oxidoreductase [Polaromonas sp.]|nr:Gfo/Idh/MocA family oxidoreductase [Polaromonas sp.]